MSAVTIDPTQVDWRRAGDGKRMKAKVRDGALVMTPRVESLKDFILMASGKVNYHISKLLNLIFNAASFTYPTPLYFALWTTSLTAASTGSSGTEAAYTSYARVAMTANTTNFPTSTSGAAIQNAVAITWPQSTGSSATCTYIAICDASTAGNMLYFGSITSTAIASGDTPQININGLTASEA